MAWMSSPMPGVRTTTHALGEAEDLDLVLAHADRLDEDLVEARRVEDVDGVGRGARETAEMAARRHRPDQDAGIRVEVLHPDPVAEDRAAGEGRRRVDGDDADLPSLGARAWRASAAVSVDLPAPGEPVRPVTRARPVRGKRSARSSGKRGSPDLGPRDRARDRRARAPRGRLRRDRWTAPGDRHRRSVVDRGA